MERDQRSQVRGAPGKLKAAVRHWLDGGDRRDDTDEALAAFGLVQIPPTPPLSKGGERSGGGFDGEPFRVHAINWPTLTVFWATWNQWRKVVLNNSVVRDGLDWSQVASAMTLSGIKRTQWPMIFEGLQAMEQQALECLNTN